MIDKGGAIGVTYFNRRHVTLLYNGWGRKWNGSITIMISMTLKELLHNTALWREYLSVQRSIEALRVL